MEYKIVDLPKIAVIGKEGLCTGENNTVQELWRQANSAFSEVAALGMTDSMRITFFVVISTLLKQNDTISMTMIPTAIPKRVRKKVPKMTGLKVSFLSITESESPTVKSIAGIVMFAIEPMLCVSHAGSFTP